MKEEKLLLRSNFSSFPHYFIYIFLTSGVKLHIHLLNVVVQFIVFLTLSTLICRSTDISKCFSESLGIRDNGSRLYWQNLSGDKYFLLIKVSLKVSVCVCVHVCVCVRVCALTLSTWSNYYLLTSLAAVACLCLSTQVMRGLRALLPTVLASMSGRGSNVTLDTDMSVALSFVGYIDTPCPDSTSSSKLWMTQKIPKFP